MSNYTNGAARERNLAHRLRNHGYDVIRTAGSHGPFDLLATKNGKSYAIECKRDRHRMPLVSWHTLWMICQRHAWTPVIADLDGCWQLVADKPAGEQIDRYLVHIELTQPDETRAV